MVTCFALSPRRDRLVVGAEDGSVVPLDLTSNPPKVGDLSRVSSDPLGRIEFTPDGNRLVGLFGEHEGGSILAIDAQTLHEICEISVRLVSSTEDSTRAITDFSLDGDGNLFVVDGGVPLMLPVVPISREKREESADAASASQLVRRLLDEWRAGGGSPREFDEIPHRIETDASIRSGARRKALRGLKVSSREVASKCATGAMNILESSMPSGRDQASSALSQAEVAVRIEPANIGYRDYLALAQYRAGMYPAALETLRESRELCAAVSETNAYSVFRILAYMSLANGQLSNDAASVQYDEAVSILRRYRDQCAGRAWRIANELEAVGRVSDARLLWREVAVYKRNTLESLRGSGGAESWIDAAEMDLATALLQAPTLDGAREAEELMRTCLPIRISRGFEPWRIANAKSLLGGALVELGSLDTAINGDTRLQHLREAESLLIPASEVLRPGVIPKGVSRPFAQDAIDRLIRLYTLWDSLEPNTGKAEKAAEWRAKRASIDEERAPSK